MEIIDLLNKVNLTPNECDALKEQINEIILKKKSNYHIHWLIHKFKIDYPFYFLSHGQVHLEQYHETYFVMAYPSRHHPEGLESKVVIEFDQDIEVRNVYFETDRYFRYDYIDKDNFPYGRFQHMTLEEYRKDQTMISSIKSQIEEVNHFCSYLFK